jgi:lysophospholipase L1-like esterase
LTKRKFFAFAGIAVALSLLLALVVALGADLYLHSRAERSAGLNRWGYRGPVAGSKQSGEVRVVVLGGSTAFGYGVKWDEAIPAHLERFLNEGAGLRARVINLGFNNEGAHSFLPTLQDFAKLDYDVVLLYEGYNDLIGDRYPNRSVVRHESVVFRLTGYFPILPLALKEKALALRFGGDLNAAYVASREGVPATTVFRPNVAERGSAAAMEAASAVSESLSRQLERLATEPQNRPATDSVSEGGCAYPWMHYCDSIFRAASYALSAGKQVAIVSQPLKVEKEGQRHQLQQQALADMVARKWSGNPNVIHVDLRDAVDLTNIALAFDGMHLNSEGNAVIARRLVAPLRALAQAREAAPR